MKLRKPMEVARFANEENDCRFGVQRENNWIHTRPTWSIAVWERLLESVCDYLLNASICSDIGCNIKFLDGS